MCGLFCCFCRSNYNSTQNQLLSNVEEYLKRRGPGYFNKIRIEVNTNWLGCCKASVLQTQGSVIQPQPLGNIHGDVLLWNGDVFNNAFNEVDTVSDTFCIMKWLSENENNILKLIASIRGPYAFIFWDNTKRILWTGRDMIGRHSLLWNLTEDCILITSVGHKAAFPSLTEVPALGIFAFKFDQKSLNYDIQLFKWSHCTEQLLTSYNLPKEVCLSKNKIITGLSMLCKGFWLTNDENVIFEQYRDDKEEFFKILVNDRSFYERVINFQNLLADSTKVRVTVLPKNCVLCDKPCDHSKIGILFSGGLDSTVLALLADKFISSNESIDLLNVAFKQTNGSFEVPDRKTGYLALEELRNLCPNRQWNFVEIDVPKDELDRIREDRICHLIYPLTSILDDSLGCALWFAARGHGTLDRIPYNSSVRILLSGIGADEQLGGYARHRTLLNRKGWIELGEQLLNETLNISRRNLGRDDRVISDNGRQPRFPYLDEAVVEHIFQLPPWHRLGSSNLPIGVGDKLLLRLMAWNLGLRKVAFLPKRAFQFGCRIANSKEKGSDFCQRL